jgi:hypothetical protein
MINLQNQEKKMKELSTPAKPTYKDTYTEKPTYSSSKYGKDYGSYYDNST